MPCRGLVFLLLLAAGTAQAQPAAGTVFRDCALCPQMVLLPDGTAMSRFAVSFDDWAACVAAGACRGGQDDHGWGRGSRPVINVSWDDAAAYAGWLSAAAGVPYALPGSAAWETAARGGTIGAFWWGEEMGRGHANCRGCGSPWEGMTAPAGSFPPNPFGLYEITGNVWAWTADCAEAPPPDGACRRRVIRGGSWYYEAAMARPAVAMSGAAGQGSYNIGIRVMRPAAPLPAQDP